MSYILEALKKAEVQRGIGQVPGLGSEHEKPAHPATGKWFWIGIAFLVLNLILLTLLLWPDPGPDTDDRYSRELSQPDVVIREPAQVSVPPPVAPPAQRAPDTGIPAAVPAVPEPAPVPALSSPPPVAPPAQRAMPDAGLPATVPAVPEPVPTSIPTPQPVIPPVQRAVPDTPPAAIPAEAEPAPGPAPVVESSVPAEFETEQAPDIDYEYVEEEVEEEEASDISSLPVWPQIPDHLFQQLTGGIPLDVHVYSEFPEDRFVLINLQKYREGEQLQEGPLLDEITPEGVILSFQGQQFLVRAQ